jgi:hypothetical protein
MLNWVELCHSSGATPGFIDALRKRNSLPRTDRDSYNWMGDRSRPQQVDRLRGSPGPVRCPPKW